MSVINDWTNLKYEEEMDSYKENAYNTRFNNNSVNYKPQFSFPKLRWQLHYFC